MTRALAQFPALETADDYVFTDGGDILHDQFLNCNRFITNISLTQKADFIFEFFETPFDDFIHNRAGLAFLITDLFSPSGYESGIMALQSKGYEVGIIHLLAPEEVEPPLAGDLRLIDIETGDPQDVSVDNSLRDIYKRRVQGWRDEIESYCLKRGVHYIPVTTNTKWDEIVLHNMRRMGIVK